VNGTSRLRWVVKYTTSGPSPTCDDRNIEPPYEWGVLKTTAIQWTGWKEDEHKTLPEEFWGAKHLEVRKGDVLVTKAGPRHRVGVSAYVDKTQPRLIVSGKMIMLRVDELAIAPRYLNWQLATPAPQAYLNACKTGMAEAQMNFANEDLLGMEIKLPPLDEQHRIADFLDIETARIDQLHALQNSVLQTLDQRDRAVRDCLLNSLIDQVGELPLRRYAPKIEQGASPSCVNHPRESGEWGVIKLSAVKRGNFFPEENKQLPDDIEPIRQYELRDRDLLVSRANTPEMVGDVAVVQGAGRGLLLPDLIYRVGLGREVRADFAAQVFLSTRVRGLIQATARGSSQSMVKLRGEDIRGWPVPQANDHQQQALVSAIREQLDSSATLRAAVDRQLALLAERRQALITAAVTGQIDVTTARGLSQSGDAAT
jgi:type I restriction enzyme, S subunit